MALGNLNIVGNETLNKRSRAGNCNAVLFAISLLHLPLDNSWRIVEKGVCCWGFPCALFSHPAEGEGSVRGHRQRAEPAVPWGSLLGCGQPILTPWWHLLSCSVATQPSHTCRTGLFDRVGQGMKCPAAPCWGCPLISDMDKHSPTLLWKLLSPGQAESSIYEHEGWIWT